jgi:acyl carrier protein
MIEDAYKHELQQMFNDIEQRAIASQVSLLFQQVTATCADTAHTSTADFGSIGGDSVTAVNLALLIQQQFKVSIPIQSLLSPDSATPAKLASLIADARRSSGGATHVGECCEEPHTMRALIEQDVRSVDSLQFQAMPPSQLDGAYNILVTGATGFIGSHLLVKLLHSTLPQTTVHCLIRARDHDDARNRIEQVLQRVDASVCELLSSRVKLV